MGLLWPDISGLAIRDLRLGNFTFVPGLTDGCEVPFQTARVLNARVPAAYTNCTRRGSKQVSLFVLGNVRYSSEFCPTRQRACCVPVRLPPVTSTRQAG